MKKTAVEWLFEQLCSEKLSWNKDSNGKLFIDKITSDIFQQAKEIEKEQMKLACIRTEYEDKAWQKLMEKQFEQYYNETYKQQNVTDDTL